ncbi:DUF3304 domain-containing protein [Enterobacter sp. 186315]
MKFTHSIILLAVLLLAGCSQPGAQAQPRSGGGGTIKAFNHTKWAINHFSVDGQSGIDIIGPYQGGGGGCCYRVLSQWRPDMKVRIDWETGAGDMDGFPGYDNWDEYLVWEKKMKALNRQHSKVVPVPDYTGQETCGITVHFMPCDEVKVTTSCVLYGNPGHPIHESIKMPEPKVCPK